MFDKSTNSGESSSAPSGTPEGGYASLGRTIGDVLDTILSEPRRLATLILMLASFALMALLFMFIFSKLFTVQPAEVQLGNTSSHFL
ncbi:hypothetical protein AciX9_1992 [Granulicella tundricola MP5ACTX9]|uniref:Uncharacterized protein n=1 Tax=Granulicella tundricola (strain ATCC BAA-1859 / DSM 23138 / MP5ACTX9) TaxID=1198114 RepID=E8X184_GRATM|nr:hypothetical protein AciX9_1992 [Granulicella tundricola MP5ACTX9]